jgi:hypothetical protein
LIGSGWTHHVERRGAAVMIAAVLWGLAIAALGYSRSLPIAIACLVLAGAADMVSGLFRMTIWNETIPSHLRGRMAAIEQLSYMSGPLTGNARAGFMAERFGLARSITWGGVACVACVVACLPLLPAFWRYRKAGTSPRGNTAARWQRPVASADQAGGACQSPDLESLVGRYSELRPPDGSAREKTLKDENLLHARAEIADGRPPAIVGHRRQPAPDLPGRLRIAIFDGGMHGNEPCDRRAGEPDQRAVTAHQQRLEDEGVAAG